MTGEVGLKFVTKKERGPWLKPPLFTFPHSSATYGERLYTAPTSISCIQGCACLFVFCSGACITVFPLATLL